MTRNNYILLPSGVLAFGKGIQEKIIHERVERWHENLNNISFLLILAGSQTAEIEGISSQDQLLFLDVIQLLQMLNFY
tara:strand:+ start:39 stop:272 length:234 start_codon:yes stop_codon:yes gene_type:complete